MELPPGRPEPARGALAGIKADLERAKKTGEAYDPRGFGNAFTHNFLNQKPWHPMNFRNQIKKFEAEQKAMKDEKLREQALAEFQAEQETMATMSYLSAEEQRRYKDRQSVSFMYAKPPGLDAALAKEAEAAKAKAEREKREAEAAAAAQAASANQGSAALALVDEAMRRTRDLDRVREDPFAVMLKAKAALQANQKFVMKQQEGATHGGFTAKDENQQLLEDEDDAGQPGPSGAQGGSQGPGMVQPGGPGQLEILPGVLADASDMALLASMSEDERYAVMKKLKKMAKEQEREQKLREAEAVLRAAGYDVGALGSAGGDSGSKKRKKHKKKSEKSKKSKSKSKHKRHKKGKGGSEDGSSSSGSSDSD